MKKLKLLLLPICVFAFSLCNLSAAQESSATVALGLKSDTEVKEFVKSLDQYYKSYYALNAFTFGQRFANSDESKSAKKFLEDNRPFIEKLRSFSNEIISDNNHIFSEIRGSLTRSITAPSHIMNGEGLEPKDEKKAEETILKLQKQYGNVINKFLENNSTSKPELKK